MTAGYRLAKRALDLAVAVPAFAITAPLTAAAAVAVRVTMGRPVLFRQTRPGLHGEPFELIKFRTMLLPEQVGTDDDAARMTRVGSFLRSTSIDELPSLLNVIRGDLSLVGPRPLLMDYLPLYSPEQMRRHEVKPGLTGQAQVNGRNATSWDERFAHDLDYVENASFGRDLDILRRTFFSVVTRRGITADGSATMHRFIGSPEGNTA